MGPYYEMTLDIVAIVGFAIFLWSIAHSFRMIAESIVQRGKSITLNKQ
jgi:hypothetical protein